MTTQTSIYLDHNATTPMRPEVRDIMLEIMDFPCNPSSVHQAGKAARQRLEAARQVFAAALHCGEKDIIVFNSGATEGNNMVIAGSGMERLIVSAIEHPAVLQAAAAQNVTTDILPVLPNGVIDLAALDKMLEGNTQQTLISVMLVNNETGVIQPVEAVSKIARKRGALVHTDAVQALGRMPLDIQALGVDFMTLSSHKMGGPQGAGCLIIANCAVMSPLFKGGNQEKSLRPGTENLAAIVSFAKAVELIDLEAYQALATLRDGLEKRLKAAAPSLKIFGADAPRVANTSMIALAGASSEAQMIALDLAGICVSNGSACASGTVKTSHVLAAMGANAAEGTAALRVSLGWNSTQNDVDCFADKWIEMYNRIKPRLSAA